MAPAREALFSFCSKVQVPRRISAIESFSESEGKGSQASSLAGKLAESRKGPANFPRARELLPLMPIIIGPVDGVISARVTSRLFPDAPTLKTHGDEPGHAIDCNPLPLFPAAVTKITPAS